MDFESAPKIEFKELLKRLGTPYTPELRKLVDKCNAEYEHWSKIKYIAQANGIVQRDLWVAVLADRLIHRQDVWPRYNVYFSLSNRMQKLCHEFDMNFGGSWGNDAIIQNAHRERYLVSSLMEEAISSSQMEGAATTRKVAKEMLRKKLTPKDRSQQMIHNNYQTIQFIVEKARALFYWYMLKRGYWLTEYLSISRVIYRAKASYEKSYLFSESEGNDIGYFISYNLRVLDIAFRELQAYITRKNKEREAAQQYLKLGGLNPRQAEVIKMFSDNPKLLITVKDIQTRFNISPTTAKTDIVGLIDLGIIAEIQLNKVKRGYVRSENFEEITKA